MADTNGLDDVIRHAITDAAQPADSKGVADSIRSRIAAGDTGTAVSGSTAPGFGVGFSWLLPAVLVAVLAGIVGTGLGMVGVFGLQADDVSVAGSTSTLNATVDVSSCPGGPVISSLPAGTRVLAVQRDDATGSVGVRNPQDVNSVMWLKPRDVTQDPDQSPIASLPQGEACPVVTVTVSKPTPTPTPKPTPSPTKKPTPPPGPSDKTAPVLATPVATKNPVSGTVPSVVTVTATDNVAVTGVKISWTGQYTSPNSEDMTLIAGKWTYTFTPTTNEDGVIHFSLQARDAAGNLSAKKTVDLNHKKY